MTIQLIEIRRFEVRKMKDARWRLRVAAAIESAERVVGRDEGRVGVRVIGGFEAGALL